MQVYPNVSCSPAMCMAVPWIQPVIVPTRRMNVRLALFDLRQLTLRHHS